MEQRLSSLNWYISAFRPQGPKIDPRLCRDLNIFVQPYFQPKLTQFSILSGSVNEYQRLLGASWELTCDGLVAHRRQDSHPLNITETGDKSRLHGPHSFKGLSFLRATC